MDRFAKLFLSAVITCLLLTVPTQGDATPIRYAFSVTATSGPLTGAVSIGSFTFDSSIIPVSDQFIQVAGLFSQLDFVWGGVAFTAATANTGALHFDSHGALIGAFFGTNCGPSGFGCGVTGGTHQWVFSYDALPNFNIFIYALPGQDPFFQTGGVALLGPIGIPTPGTLPLLLVALISPLLLRGRRQPAKRAPARDWTNSVLSGLGRGSNLP